MNVIQPIRKRLPMLLGFTAGLALLVAFLTFGRLGNALANSNDLGNFTTQYPATVGTRIDTCVLCHTASIPNLNPYGAAYKANGRNSAALVAIQNLDSDGDGFTNLQEITALTFPGDPNDHPASASPTPTHVPSATPTHQVTATATTPAVTSMPIATGTRPAVSGTPHTTRTPRVTRTPRPTRQPTPCGSESDNEDGRGPTPNPTTCPTPSHRRGGE